MKEVLIKMLAGVLTDKRDVLIIDDICKALPCSFECPKCPFKNKANLSKLIKELKGEKDEI